MNSVATLASTRKADLGGIGGVKRRRTLVLIAEDGDIDRRILEVFVRREGWDVVSAVDGHQAVALFHTHRPDIVLMDALMPRMNGFDAARAIKLAAGDAMVPIIFLTSLQETKELVRCFEAGGDDFLSKPYNTVILGAKLKKFAEMRTLHEQLRIEREKVTLSNAHLLREQAVAKALFDNIVRPRGLEATNIKSHVSPLAIFNGDVLLSSRTPSGGLNVFLGDFTGHGLPAAIGALPTAEIFYSMSVKGFAVGEVVAEINCRLNRVLPVGVFCCASMVHFDFARGDIEVWHGGLPPAAIYSAQSRGVALIHSEHLPLGVVPSKKFDATVRKFSLAPEDRLMLCSDGVVEASNRQGEMFGSERYVCAMRSAMDPNTLFAATRDAVLAFAGTNARDDDFTLVEVAMAPLSQLSTVPELPITPEAQALDETVGPTSFQLRYELRDASLGDFNPLPMLQQLMLEVPGLRGATNSLYTILTELYANALDHGVLRLDSSLKNADDGFATYFKERTRRLRDLRQGYVSIELEHHLTSDGGELRVLVCDSGQGFDFVTQAGSLNAERALSGRGIALVRRLCETVRFLGNGNRVEVLYRWRH